MDDVNGDELDVRSQTEAFVYYPHQLDHLHLRIQKQTLFEVVQESPYFLDLALQTQVHPIASTILKFVAEL